ncbi:hypothetical protein OSJ57_26920, partial [Sphingomonas sp. HH69]
ETFTLADLQAAVEQAIDLGAIGFDAVKHLVLCRIERVPPRLDENGGAIFDHGSGGIVLLRAA